MTAKCCASELLDGIMIKKDTSEDGMSSQGGQLSHQSKLCTFLSYKKVC